MSKQSDFVGIGAKNNMVPEAKKMNVPEAKKKNNPEAKKNNVSEAKKTCKGILKTSGSFDKANASGGRKSARFDELNVLQTYHPADKDYGHMKVDEPKTPFAYSTETDPGQDFDPELLAEKLRQASDFPTPLFTYDEDSEEDIAETAPKSVHRLEFEKRRKAHYNKYKAVLLARKLIQVELETDVNSDEEALSDQVKASSSFANEQSSKQNDSSCKSDDDLSIRSSQVVPLIPGNEMDVDTCDENGEPYICTCKNN